MMKYDISPVDLEYYKKCEEKWLTIAKPLYSLGKLEKAINQIGAIRKNVAAPISKRLAVIMCADNGVVAEGISQTDESVTQIVADNLATGKANLNILSQGQNLDICAVDIGMKYDAKSPNVFQAKVRKATGNIHKEIAMTKEEAIKAIEVGIAQVEIAAKKGYDLILTGEMGIGNTTTSSACASVLLNIPAEEVTGKGAGLSAEGVKHKINIIKEAIKLHKPDREDPIDVVSKIGGLDIAGMMGIFIGGGIYHIPIVIDGVISSIAALLAARMYPNLKGYMLASHVSKEPAGKMILDELELFPVIQGDLALGEGTGAACLLPLLDMVHQVYDQNVTFEEIHMEAYKKL